MMGHEFKSNKLLLVEGKDEVNFFKAYNKHLGIVDIEIYDVGGKDKFKKEIPYIVKAPSFNNIDILGIIRDADENFQDALNSVKSTLTKNGLDAPTTCNMFTSNSPKVGIFIIQIIAILVL